MNCLDILSFPTQNLTATAGNAQALVSFSAPVSDGESAITGYTVTSDPSGGTDVNAGSTATIHTITGLKNGTAYTFSVQASNAAGSSIASSPSNSVTPLHVPETSANVTATAGNAQAMVSFSAPKSDGGSAITGYTVTSNPSGGTDINAGSTAMIHTITGLKNGTAYTFSVQASNAVGSSIASSPSNSVTPFLVPGAPVNVTATAGNARAMVSFSVPVSDGGSAITGYTVTSDPSGGKDVNAGSTVLTHAITGLNNDTAYTFSVQAAKSAGTGPASSPSNSVTPSDVPEAPTNVTATAGNAQAMVSFSAPESDGGSAISGYTVTSNPSGGKDVNAGSTAFAHTITGLKNGTAYTFSVQAANIAKTSPASSPSNRVTPSDVPGVPTNVTATAGNARALVSFSAPKSDGGSAITGYTVTSNPSGGTDNNAGSTAMTHAITGLKNGTTYTFSVQTANIAKTSPASSPSNRVTPIDVPGSPANVTATAGNARAMVSFSAPVSDGGSAITGYTVTSNPSGGKDVNAGSTVLTHTITGLKNSTSYTFLVQASKTAGSGPASSPSNSVTPSDVPGSPANVTATAGNAQAMVSFSAPVSDGGSAITGYTVTSDPTGGKDVNAGSTAMTHTITGLKNGTAYTFSVQATNNAKTSPASSPSNRVTPIGDPGAPVNVTATAGSNAQAIVSFSAPVSDGGSAITGYTVTSNPSGGKDVNAGSTVLTHTIVGLINGTAFTFSVQAENATGTGPASSPSNSMIPVHPEKIERKNSNM
ncbi:MAG: fibronectin type III domain-containing protein [Desulfuromonadales bacterium]|nr:fibronectin type III domain-containing protein [Desulfuromonadales bacterium]